MDSVDILNLISSREFKIKCINDALRKSKNKDKLGEFSGYPRGMKNEVIAHYQQGCDDGIFTCIDKISEFLKGAASE